MLNFVLGRACAGKSHYIIEKAALESLNKDVIVIIPEQFSFETERAILHTKNVNTDNIKVMSFTKLYTEVSRDAGFGKLPVISDSERILLTDSALKQSSEHLLIFDKFVHYPDFCTKIADTIQDFKFASVSSDELLLAAEQIGGSCGAKLHDIAVIMAVYEGIVSNRFIDPSDYLTRLSDLLCDYEYFKNKAVFVDSFSGFTGQQFKIIEKILIQADDVTFSFCSDDIDCTDINLFYNINSTAQKIRSLARRACVKVGDTVYLENNYYSNKTLKNLELSFVERDSEISVTDESENLRIIRCADPREEVFAATNIIRYLVDKKNYRYRDFMVVARNADDYKNYIEVFCKKNKIQCFIDKKINLTDTLLFIYIDSLLKIKTSFSTENILAWLKCGLNSYNPEDIYALEDYLHVWNISGRDWAKEWSMNPSGFENSVMKEEEKQQLVEINKIRADIYSRLSGFCSAFKGDARRRSEILFKFIDKENVAQYLSLVCQKSEKNSDRFTASVLRQAWDQIMTVLNSVARLLEGDIKTEAYAKAFRISCSAVNISNVPQMLDEVTFGSADRIRPSKPKVAIILGANQGVFPNHATKNGLLVSSDKQKLEDYGISLNDSLIKGVIEENYLVYSMLCCPIDKTFILFSKKTASGNALEASVFVSNIEQRLNNVTVTDYKALSEEMFMPSTPEAALHLLSEINGNDFETVKASLENVSEAKEKVKSFSDASFNENYIISGKNSDKLFNQSVYISASKFDNFHTCRLMYFLKHGLRTGKLRQADLNSMQRGTIVHFVLESMINRYHKRIGELTEREISLQVDGLIDEYISSISGSEILLTPRFKFLLSRISRSVKEVVKHIVDEFRQSDFEPAYCELEISESGDIPELRIPIDKGEMVLTGKIDRVDLYKNNVRIVDYKTGSKTFELSDTLFGLNMQMLIYLYAVIKNGRSISEDIRPAGILYMPAKSDSKNKTFSMNGLIIEDEDIIYAMDKENNGKFIPAYKSGNKSFADDETFNLIFDNIEKLIKCMGATIREGNFTPEPIDSLTSDACKYCDFSSICRKSNMPHFKVTKLKNEQIKEKLRGGDTSVI